MSIQVLMSTYNGEVFLEEQVRSIMQQTCTIDSLLVRDDGSVDSTLKVLYALKKEYPQITVIEGKNVGWRKSFFELLKHSGEYDFYAFADQDDVWYEDKVEKAISALKRLDQDEPNLFQCKSEWVNRELERLESQPILRKPGTTYEVVLNVWAQGAQMVFNRKLREMARVYEPAFPCAHDVWVYDIAFLMGTVLVSEKELMMYRRHDESVTTVKNGSIYQGIRAYKKIGAFGNYARELVKAFSNELEQKNENVYVELQMLADYKKNVKHKAKLIFNREIKKQTFLGTANLKMQILCSRY